MPPAPTPPVTLPQGVSRVPPTQLWQRTATLHGPWPLAIYRHLERNEVRIVALRIAAKEAP